MTIERKFRSFEMIPDSLEVLDLGRIMVVHKQQLT
jgi:hypothetical protein